MTRLRKNSRARSRRALNSAVRQVSCEALEDRRLLSVTVVGIPNWVEQGPGPTNGGQDFTFSSDPATSFTKISGTLATSDGLDNDVDGSVDEAGEQNLPNSGNVHIAPDPGNTNRFYAGIAGVGIFRSDNGGANWVKINNGLSG